MNLLDACKLAYRKHVLNDDSVGWDELGNCLLDAICNEIGDDGYQQWLQQVNSADKSERCYCKCDDPDYGMYGICLICSMPCR